MVTTIELVLDIKLETEFAPKRNSFGDELYELEKSSKPIWLEKLLEIAISC
jgi:hypothetical protein